jgi:hypothetical protein
VCPELLRRERTIKTANKKIRLEGKKPGNDLAEERIMPIFA